MASNILHPDRLFPESDPGLGVARALYGEVAELPIVSPHGHTDPAWYADNRPFRDPAELLVTTDHYLLRMFRSQGLDYGDFGVPLKGEENAVDGRDVWRRFCAQVHLFLGTPSRLWIEHALHAFFGIEETLSPANADATFDLISEELAKPGMRPLAILDRANVETIATTEGALDDLAAHRSLQWQGLIGRIRTTYRPDEVADPDTPGFAENLERFAEITGENTATWAGLMRAHEVRRAEFREFGATATDHGTPSAVTCDLDDGDKQKLLDKALAGRLNDAEAEAFRGQMLTEMARLSAEDGMVMQLHAGVLRNHDGELLRTHGRHLGADMPVRADLVNGLRPLLERYGREANFRLIVFTLDETTYARELAPMAGYWPALRIGPPWWFYDSPRGMRRYLDAVVETAGFRNLAGFNDDTRAILSIPARHDVWRREVCRFLAGLVCEHQLSEDEAAGLARYLSYQAAKDAYGL